MTTKVKSISGHHITIYGRHKLETHAIDVRGTAGYTEQEFLAADLEKLDMILGAPWLNSVNPDIDWKRGS